MSLNNSLQDSAKAGTEASTGSSLLEMLRTTATPMSRTGAGELTSQYGRVFQELQDKESNAIFKMFKVIPIDAAAAGVAMGCVAITARDGNRVYSYLLLLEATAPNLGSQTIKAHNNGFGQSWGEVSIPYVTGDLYRDSYWAKIQAFIAKQHGVQAEQVIDCSASPVYAEMSPAKTTTGEEVVALRPLFFAAVNSIINSVKMNDPSFKDFNCADLSGFRVSAKTAWQNSAVIDETGLPVRAGFLVQTYATASGNNTDVAIAGTIPLTQVTGYVDLIQLTPDGRKKALQVQTGMNEMAIQQMLMMPGAAGFQAPCWMPRVVCTHLEALGDAVTLQSLLASLFTNAIVMQNGAWRHGFAKKFNDKFHSLQGLSLELQASVNPDDDAFSLTQFLQANVSQQPVLSVLLPDVGPTSHIWNILRIACTPTHPNYSKAHAAVYQALVNLTGGKIQEHLNPNDPLGFIEDSPVPLGYYYAQDNTKRSLSDIDHLAVANLSADLSVIQKWADSNNFELNVPVENRTADKLQVLNQLFEGKYRLKAWARLLTLNPKLFIGGWKAWSDSVGGIRLENSMESLDEQQRGMFGIVNYAIDTSLLGTAQQGFGFNNSSFGSQTRTGGFRFV